MPEPAARAPDRVHGAGKCDCTLNPLTRLLRACSHRVEGESTSGETRVEGERSTSNDGEEQDTAVKRPRLEDISTLAAEPLQEWLGNLPRDDLQL